jgi:hypothetical protein
MIKRTDANHKEIIDKLRQFPALSVFSTHMVGKGFPDIVIGYKGMNYLVEIKDGAKSKSRKKLTDDEIKFHVGWFGQIMIAENIDDVLRLLKIIS